LIKASWPHDLRARRCHQQIATSGRVSFPASRRADTPSPRGMTPPTRYNCPPPERAGVYGPRSRVSESLRFCLAMVQPLRGSAPSPPSERISQRQRPQYTSTL
jgi:hypothetical protein